MAASETVSAEEANESLTQPPENQNSETSALQDNIARKGKNAYYFAHAHKATGPKWDGKPQPKLLSRQSSTDESVGRPSTSFHYHKSNITSYAFSDEGNKVKLYIEMKDVGEKCEDSDVTLESTANSFCLMVNNYKPEPQCLSFGKLTAEITGAKFKMKKDRIILILTKANEGEWHTINDKGEPDHEVV